MLTRNAITAGVDTRVRFDNRTYEAAFSVGLTYIDGEPAAIERVQRASGHYLQRVDQPTIRLDPTRRTLGGTQITGSFNKIAGRHWLWGGNIMIESPEFDPLDFGRLNYAGDYTGEPAHHLPRDASRAAVPVVLVQRQRELLLVFRHRSRRAATRSAAAPTSRSTTSGRRRSTSTSTSAARTRS